MRPHLVCVVYVVLGTAFLSAQDPAFEVASIRPTQNTTQRSGISPTPWGRFTATNATAKGLLLRAYGLVDAQLIGAPSWLATERYDIDARAAAPAGGPDALMPMVRRLFVERFNLEAHTEMRELSAYALIVARRDSRLGSHIRPTNTDCTRATTLTQDEVRAGARDGWPPCGMAYFVNFTTTTPAGNNVKMRVRRSGTTMSDLATALQQALDRPVIDQTSLSGRYDVEYSYAPGPQTPGVESAFGPEAPQLLVALEEQLGLKLESRRMSVPVLVIDSIDRPSEN